MGEGYGWLSVIPPVVAIGMAIATRQVILSLLAGVWIGWLIVAGFDPLAGTVAAVNCLVGVFDQPWRVMVLLFTLLVGALLILIQRNGGLEAFTRWAERWPFSRSRLGAQLLAYVLGLGVFIESNITCLVVGTVSRPLFDRLRISREKLAYLCDATSAPVCILLPINGWGAMVLGLLAAEAERGNLGDASPLGVFLAAVPRNFYALLALGLALALVLTGFDFGPMRRAERRAREEGKLLRDGAMPVVDVDVLATAPKEGTRLLVSNMVVPLLVMFLAVPVGIAVTGWNALPEDLDIAPFTLDGVLAILDHASGTTAVFWAVGLGLVAGGLLSVARRNLGADEVVQTSLKGAGALMPLAAIMLLAFALGMTCEELKTGQWVAETVRESGALRAEWMAPVIFLVSGFIAFSTGTSWGTFAIMVPLAMPLAHSYQLAGEPVSLPTVLAAVLGGGVFGDHCSPISDTTVVSSMAAASDHIDHVRTQLPYALLAAAGAAGLYYVFGFTSA